MMTIVTGRKNSIVMVLITVGTEPVNACVLSLLLDVVVSSIVNESRLDVVTVLLLDNCPSADRLLLPLVGIFPCSVQALSSIQRFSYLI